MSKNNEERGEVLTRVNLTTGKHLSTNDLPRQEGENVDRVEKDNPGGIKVTLHGNLALKQVTSNSLPKKTSVYTDIVEDQVNDAQDRRRNILAKSKESAEKKEEAKEKKDLIKEAVKEVMAEVGEQIYDEIEKSIKAKLQSKEDANNAVAKKSVKEK